MEQEVLAYLAKGKSFYETAIKFGLEPKEVIAIYATYRAKG
jgi:DNA-binding CsgD family transcriptional regulator